MLSAKLFLIGLPTSVIYRAVVTLAWQTSMPDLSPNLEATLYRAVRFAKERNHLSVGLEHLLLSLLQDNEARLAFLAFQIDIDDLTRLVRMEVDRYPLHRLDGKGSDDVTTPLSSDLNRAIGVTLKNASIRKQDNADGVNALYGILESESSVKDILVAFNMTELELSYWMQFGVFEDQNVDLKAVSRQHIRSKPSINESALTVSSIPHQSTAPVRVEEMDGKLIRVSHRSTAIDADELDFDRWRTPVANRLRELLDEDLGPGTNHSRLRRRLLDLAEALAGTIDDVKENQFRLGYAIEALGLLVGVYRTAADDMPTLNAAVFVDVDHLHIQLLLGRSKLAAWTRFQRDADADELEEGGADPAAVGASLDEAARVLEGDAAAPVVDPELPRSFRWIRAAIADPATTTRRMVYGAVKSVENVVSFLGQIVLRTAKRTAEVASASISTEVAADLLNRLAHAALQLSAALPTEWAWLKPLLDVVSKLHGM